MSIPTKEECLKILRDAGTPDNIIAHTSKVCEIALKVCGILEKKDIKADKQLVAAAALLHDIKKLSKNDHIIEGCDYVTSLGYPEVAAVMRTHGLSHIENDEFFPKTAEQKIVFYADKRANGDKLVSVDERFDYIMKKYSRKEIQHELQLTKQIEKELLGSNPEF